MVLRVTKKRKIGLLGGSFNPPHAGHIHISKQAIRTLNLETVWWIISPQNPLKEKYSQTYSSRIKACNKILKTTNIKISEIERREGNIFSFNTIRILKKKYPRIQFFWIIGADNMHSINRWKNWDSIFMEIPVAVFSRPSQQVKAGLSMAAQKYQKYRVNPRMLSRASKPAWSMRVGPQLDISSTRLRNHIIDPTGV